MYKYILEKLYGVKVAGMCLVRCHPNIETYERVVVNDMQDEIQLILKKREETLYPKKKEEEDNPCLFSSDSEIED